MDLQERGDVATNISEHTNDPDTNDTEKEVDMSNKRPTNQAKPPEGGWAWVVCFACFIAHVIVDGLLNSFGVVFTELLDYFKQSKGETAVIASLIIGTCFLVGPLAASAVNKFGSRIVVVAGTLLSTSGLILSIFAPNIQYLYFSLGIMLGSGYGMIYLPSIVTVNQYFENNAYRARAVGIGISGTGVGMFMFSPIITLLIDTYSWRGAILIQAAIVFHCLACGLVYQPINQVTNSSTNQNQPREPLTNNEFGSYCYDVVSKGAVNTHNQNKSVPICVESAESEITESFLSETKKNTVSREKLSSLLCSLHRMKKTIKGSFNRAIYTNVAFCLYLVSMLFFTVGYFVPYVYLPDTAREMGIDEFKASFLISTIGITNIIGRVLFGFLADQKCLNRCILFASTVTTCGVVTLVVPFFKSYGLFVTYSIIYGVFTGGTITLSSIIVSDIVGVKNIADAFGARNFFIGVGALLGSPLAGWLSDTTGDYEASYITAGVLMTLGGTLFFSVPCFGRLHIFAKKPS